MHSCTAVWPWGTTSRHHKATRMFSTTWPMKLGPKRGLGAIWIQLHGKHWLQAWACTHFRHPQCINKLYAHDQQLGYFQEPWCVSREWMVLIRGLTGRRNGLVDSVNLGNLPGQSGAPSDCRSWFLQGAFVFQCHRRCEQSRRRWKGIHSIGGHCFREEGQRGLTKTE